MTSITSVIATNSAAMVLLFTLILNYKSNIRKRLFADKLFLIMVVNNFIQCVVELSCFLIAGHMFPGCLIIAAILNSLDFAVNSVISFLWLLYLDYKLFDDKTRIWEKYRFLSIPMICILIGSIINIFTPIFFRITDDNIYERNGVMMFIPYGVAYFYMIYGTVLVFKNKKKAAKNVFLPVLVYLLPLVLASIAQFIFYGQSLYGLGIAIALNSFHMNLQNEAYANDILSGLFSRQYLVQYLGSCTRALRGKMKIVGIMLDIDKFKTINDSYGHLIGDDAIRSAGIILRSSTPKQGIASRYGGDEFIIIFTIMDENEIQQVINKIQKTTSEFNQNGNKEYRLEFSIGYSIWNSTDESVDAFFGKMDVAMYQNKRQRLGERRRSCTVEQSAIIKQS